MSDSPNVVTLAGSSAVHMALVNKTEANLRTELKACQAGIATDSKKLVYCDDAAGFHNVVCETTAGLVGIGTSSPSVALHVIDSTSNATVARFASAGTSVGGAFVGILSNEGDVNGTITRAVIGGVRNTDNNGDFVVWTRTSGSLTEKMRLTKDGYLGVGTAFPARALDVVGVIQVSGNHATDGDLKYNLISKNSSTAYNAGASGGIGLFAQYKSDNTMACFGGVSAGKENVTDANYASYLAFHARRNGGSVREVGRFSSEGFLGVNTSAPKGIIDAQLNTGATPQTAVCLSVGPQPAGEDLTNGVRVFAGRFTLPIGGTEVEILPDWGSAFGYNKAWTGELTLCIRQDSTVSTGTHAYIKFMLWNTPSGSAGVQILEQLHASATGLSGYFATTDTASRLCCYVKTQPDASHSGAVAIKNNHSTYVPDIIWTFIGSVQ